MKKKDTEKKLSPKQLEVLNYRSHGLSSTEIAVKMEVSPETVKTHQTETMKRLAAKNSTHAVAIALRKGLIV